MMRIIPCFWLNDEAEEAAAFYAEVFPDARVVTPTHYPEGMDNPSDKPRGSVLTVEVDIGGLRFTLLNGGPYFKMNPSISFYVRFASEAEVDRAYAALVEGGTALMPLGSYPFNPRFGWVQDRFGASWQLLVDDPPAAPRVMPCLLFAGPARGRAMEAMDRYAEVFGNSRAASVGPVHAERRLEGGLEQGRLQLGDETLVLFDGLPAHEFSFDEGVSLQVMCQGQSEIDYFWDALADGGKESRCGWVTDRFGVCWQVVPHDVIARMTAGDAEGRDRAFKAMLEMNKLDIAALEAALRGDA